MTFQPGFPTILHQETAEIVRDYFLNISSVDTVLLVNSCARGQAVPESDLDFAILANPGTTKTEIKNLETTWHIFSDSHPTLLKYKQSNKFAHLHLDVIDGNYIPAILLKNEPIDNFEIEIGNQICYSAPMDRAGTYFQDLQIRWLPYYKEDLRLQRYELVREACTYDLDHVSIYVKRKLFFQAFHLLWKAFQEFLQALFIANKMYPIAYDKWIKEQVVNWLNKPELYPKLAPILSINNIESNEIIGKANMLREMLDNLLSE